MKISEGSDSTGGLVECKPRLLESDVMFQNYTTDLLFLDEARVAFVELDLLAISRYPSQGSCPFPLIACSHACERAAGTDSRLGFARNGTVLM